MDFHQFPKVELHLHLDCSLSYSVVSHLNPSVTHKEYLETFIAPAKCTNLADCLTRALKGIELMQTEEELRLVTLDLFEQLQQDNILYAEIRFAPLLHTEQGLSSENVVAIVEAATKTASQANGVEARLILCTLRPFFPKTKFRNGKTGGAVQRHICVRL
jgi:adenosine deaminase